MEKSTLLCLHGWGGSKKSFDPLREALKDRNIEVLTPDLPGFGDEPEPNRPWNTDDYASWVIEYIQNSKFKIQNSKFLLLGHSHGGRIAIKLVANHMLPIDHLFLCAAAGIRHPRHFKRITGLILAKAGKVLLSLPGLHKLEPLGKKFLYKLVRVHDYEKASDIMRQALINVSAEDLRPLLSKIDVPTEIFWGKDDGMTPYGDALIMKSEIPNSVLHSYEGVRHAVHKDKAQDIADCIRGTIA
jgi:pyruvate dehydrogenase E2 component (dihydrolipoamide acetyltransferase)